jgi:outer membrane protein assembly factor BamB
VWPSSFYDVGATSHAPALGPRNVSVRFLSPVSEDPWGVAGSPVFGANGDVLVLLFNGTLLSLDALSGAARWAFPMISGGLCSPSLSRGAVLIADLMGYIYRLDARTGALAWRAGPYPARITADPVESGARVFVADGDAAVRALSFSTGALLWEASPDSLNLTGASFQWRPSLAMADGTSPCPEDAGCDTLYLSPSDVNVQTRDAAVLALHAASGALRFRFAWPAPPGTAKAATSAAAVLNGRVFWVTGSAVFCVNASSGALLYNTTPARYYNRDGGLMLLLSRTADLLIVPIMNEGTFGLRASTGDVLWQNGGSVSPAVGALDGGGVLFVMDVGNYLRALNASSGEQLMLDSGAAFEVATGWGGYSSSLAMGPNSSIAALGVPLGARTTMLLMVGAPLAPLAPAGGGGGGAQNGAGADAGLGALRWAGASSAVALLALLAARSGWGGAMKALFGDGKASLRGVEVGINTEDFHASLLPSEDESAGAGFALLTAGEDESAGAGFARLTAGSAGSSGSALPLWARGGGAGAPRRVAWPEGPQGGDSEPPSRQPTLVNDPAVEGAGEPVLGLAQFDAEPAEWDGDSFVLEPGARPPALGGGGAAPHM